MYRHLNAIRLGWLRVRSECLAHRAAMKHAADPDLEAFLTWVEYAVPVIYDLLQAAKKPTEPFYWCVLVHFAIVLYLLDRTLHVSAFDVYMRDLLLVKRTDAQFYVWFMSNLNRDCVCLHIEYQHKLPAPFTDHLTERDAGTVDPFICSLPALRDSNEHAATYDGLLTPPSDACSLASIVHGENHVQLWASALSCQLPGRFSYNLRLWLHLWTARRRRRRVNSGRPPRRAP